MEHQSLYGNSSLHLFTYFRTAGSSTGNRIGGYDELQTGFIRNSSATLFSGAVFISHSQVGGPYYYSAIELQLYAGRWWVSANGQWIGYYPTQNSTADVSTQRITFDLIGASACEAHWYGEYWDPSVSSSPLVNWTNGDMGSGRLANSSDAAWIYRPRLGITSVSDSSSSNGGNAPSANGPGYDTDCYSVSGMLYDNGIPFFRVGGPGGNGAGCN